MCASISEDLPMRSYVAALVCVLVGCAGGGGEPPGGSSGGGTQNSADGGTGVEREALSGSRLKNRYVSGEDGSRMPLGFFDTARNEACSQVLTADGYHCLPLENSAFTTLSGTFADSRCSVHLATSSCAGSRYAFSYSDTCPIMYTLYTVTPHTDSKIYLMTSTGCSEAAKSSANYYDVGPATPLTDFVRGVDQHE